MEQRIFPVETEQQEPVTLRPFCCSLSRQHQDKYDRGITEHEKTKCTDSAVLPSAGVFFRTNDYDAKVEANPRIVQKGREK